LNRIAVRALIRGIIRAVLKRAAKATVTLMPKKPPRDWAWKRLLEAASPKQRTLNYRRPDYMTNAHGQTVRYHAPHPVTPATERFMALVRIVPNADDLDCWQWHGGDTFRVDEQTVTTPQRFIWREATCP
jgi:hypothetical protein